MTSELDKTLETLTQVCMIAYFSMGKKMQLRKYNTEHEKTLSCCGTKIVAKYMSDISNFE